MGTLESAINSRKMKYFAFVLLFGLASASLLEIYPDSDEQDFLLKADKHKGKDDLQTELARQLRKTLDHILKEIKQTVEEGKDVSQDLLDQARDLVHKLKAYGEDVSDEAKDLLNYLKTRVQRWAEELLNILRDDSSTVHRASNGAKTELGKKLNELLHHIVSRIKQSVEEGKHISEDLFDKAKEVAKKLKDYGVHVSDDAKSLLEELKSKYSKWAQELLDIIHGKKASVHRSKEGLETELGKRLRDALERVLRRINHTIEEGKHVSKKLVDEAKDLVRRLRKYGLDVSDEAKDMLHYLKDRFTRWVDELLDLIRGDNNSTTYYSEPEVKTELAKKLREEFEHIVKRIKKLVQDGKHVSQKLIDEAKDLAKRLREYGLNVKDEVVDMLEYLKDRYQKWVQELIDVIRGNHH